MRNVYIILSLILITSCKTTKLSNYNIQSGYMAEGYDVVAYFDDKAVEGKSEYQLVHEGVGYKFSSKVNMEKFQSNPDAYIPQYGGYCAYAIGKNGDKVKINPKTYEIRDGKLYLFYNTVFANTLDKWTKEGAEELKDKADVNWIKITDPKQN